MKIIRNAIPAIAMLVLLNGCAAKNEAPPPETQLPTMESTAPLETAPIVKKANVEEETIPARESVQKTEAASNTVPTTPAAEPEKEREETQPVQTEPPAVEPAKKEPAETQPQATEPPETEPEKNVPAPTDTPESIPEETTPPETVPAETEPPATEPLATEPSTTEPPATEPIQDEIDTSALASYGRRYAASTYGYNGNPNCNPSTNAGYFPGVRVKVTTMEEGYAAAREAVDYQYACDVAMGRAISAEIDGVTVRRNINVYFEPTDDPQVFIVWCYYGGEA